jgi:hypothetical protein
VDEAAEHIPAADISGADRHWVPGFGQWRREGEPAMGPLAVVVRGVGPKGAIEVAPTEDERPVEALDPDGLDHPFGVGIGVRGPGRGVKSQDVV